MVTDVAFGTACFFPCILLGQIRSKLSRESSCSIARLKLGPLGCRECVKTSVFCCICWPISPCLGCYLHHEREKLRIVYNSDPLLQKYNSYEVMKSFIMWPKNIIEMHRFLLLMESENRLVNDWDISHYRDYISIPKPEICTIRAFLIGDNSAAKQLFFKKLLKFTEEIATLPKPFDTEDSSKQSFHTVHSNVALIGLKSVLYSQREVHYLELWDVLTDGINSYSIRQNISSIDAAMFVFYLTEDQLQPFQFYNDIVRDQLSEMTKKLCVVLVDKIEEEEHSPDVDRDAPNTLHPTGAQQHLFHMIRESNTRHAHIERRESSRDALLEKIQLWAKENQCEFFRVSLNENLGIRAIQEYLSSLRPPLA